MLWHLLKPRLALRSLSTTSSAQQRESISHALRNAKPMSEKRRPFHLPCYVRRTKYIFNGMPPKNDIVLDIVASVSTTGLIGTTQCLASVHCRVLHKAVVLCLSEAQECRTSICSKRCVCRSWETTAGLGRQSADGTRSSAC